MSKQKRLSRERIAAAALAIADKEGFAAVSMRRVADDLGVGTMSLYYYVKTKDDLMAVMDDALMGEALVAKLPRDWRRALLAIAQSTHEVFVRHPWAIVSMLSAPPGLNAMHHLEQCLEALSTSDLNPTEQMTLLANVDDFVFGYSLRESAEPSDVSFAAENVGAFPRVEAFFAKGRIEHDAARFERALTSLLDSYKPRRSSSARTRAMRRSPTRSKRA